MIRESLNELLALFNLVSKKEVERYCRSLKVRSEDLSDLILAGRIVGIPPYQYRCHFADLVPEDVRPNQEELAALSSAKVGQLQGQAMRAVRKFSQTSKVRRLASAHLFYTRSHKYWHLFYFDQRDYANQNNHWKHGAHIHYSRESFANEPLQDVWNKVCANKPEFPKAVHIRYDYRHNRSTHTGA